jgi:molybdenum cofactor cytidylyltransferase
MKTRDVAHIGVLLAAGAGSRFGGAYAGAKLDQLIDGVTVGARAFDNLAAAVDTVMVVVRAESSGLGLLAASHGATVIVNPSPERGLGFSLALAVRRILASSLNAHFLWVALADMPWIKMHTFLRLARLASEPSAESFLRIVQPVFIPSTDNAHDELVTARRGKPGHPVVFGCGHFAALAALDGDVGARDLIETNSATLIRMETSDEGIWRDVDSPDDLVLVPRNGAFG